MLKGKTLSQEWWHKPVVPTPGKQRQTYHCDFKASLVYIMSSRPDSSIK